MTQNTSEAGISRRSHSHVLFLCSAAPKSLLPGAPVLGHRCSRRCAQPTQRQLPLRQREGAPKAPMLLLPVLQRVIDGSQKTTVALPIHKALMIVMMEPMLRPTTMMSLFPWDLNLQKTKRPWEEECDNEKVQLKTIGKDVALTVGQTPG
ncbi:uncharacterized protein [Zea mays]|uniref:Uncharacterized protein n=1 Tax=Zea mays TaxID=4577 RepID=B4FC15_MAIZE|nr:uncharacterized protein LOC100277590 isoform X2 [Zea mays]ACF79658.1 unknown [Zea mays]ACF85637.1 unknown [Zea mays]ACF87771.1 unknown [Zea mays]ACG31796.1 hypothetical protein [Zea mays]ACN28049.1 unknown [Zea mays]